MEAEELLLKMGFNAEPAKQGIGHFETSLKGLKKEFGHTTDSFISAGSATKSFKGLLHELSDVAPGFGAAMKIAIDPVTGILQLATAVFKSVMEDIKEWNTALDAAAKQAAKPLTDFEAAARAVEKQVAATNAQYEAWKKTLADGKPGEAENGRIAERLRLAKAEAAGDEEAFARRKIEIAQEEELFAIEKQRGDEAAADAAEEELTDKARLTRYKMDAEALDKLVKRQEQLKDLIPEQQKKVDDLFQSNAPLEGLINMAGGGAVLWDEKQGAERLVQETLLNGLIGEREQTIAAIHSYEKKIGPELEIQKTLELRLKAIEDETMSDKERADKMHAARQQAENDLEDLLAKKRHQNLTNQIALAKEDAGGDEVKFLQEKLHLQEAARLSAELNGRKQEEKEITDQILLTNRQLLRAQAARTEAQITFNYELEKARNQRDEEVNSRYRPAIEQVAKSDDWTSPFTGFHHSESSEETSLKWLREHEERMGDSYLQAHADQAANYLALQEQAKILYRMEGPTSKEYLEAVEKISNLHGDLFEAGLLKEDPLKSIDEHIRKLVARAEKEGLVIQPTNG